MALKSSQQELQLWFKPRPNPSLGRGVMSVQSPGNPNRDSFETPLWESREKESFDAGAAENRKEHYMGEGGGFPRIWVMLSQVSSSARG
jgi:hypothetical protein